MHPADLERHKPKVSERQPGPERDRRGEGKDWLPQADGPWSLMLPNCAPLAFYPLLLSG